MLWLKKTNEIGSIRFPGAKVRICSETILWGGFGFLLGNSIYLQSLERESRIWCGQRTWRKTQARGFRVCWGIKLIELR